MSDRKHHRLEMRYQGAEWVQRNLDACHRMNAERVAARKRVSKRSLAISKTMSPLGVAVADLLGFVYQGIYHLSWSSLERVHWDDDRFITVTVNSGMASYDGGDLTTLLVAAHDMCMRVEIYNGGPRSLVLGFSARAREGAIYDRHPTMDEHLTKIREQYNVVEQQGPWPPPPPPKPTLSPWDPPRKQLGCCVDRQYSEPSTRNGSGNGCTQDTCMHLPVVGQTCNDCAHVERCVAMFGQKREDTSCQFFPRRFLARATAVDTAGVTS